MHTLRHLTAADARRVPWKNGRGVTEELLLWPPGSSLQRGDFDWRLSRAAVDEPGPFSAFPGFERILVITSGAGLWLDHGSAAPRARVPPLQPHRFSGDWASSATLCAGPVADFNVLARRGSVRADVTVLRPGPARADEPLGPGHTVLHVITGEVEAGVAGDAGVVGDAATRVLAAGESLWLRDPGPGGRLEFTRAIGPGGAVGPDGSCVALLVRLEGPAGSAT